MANKIKVLVVNNDLNLLSKIYLTLLHRNYKVEASDKTEEISERLKRFKPAVLVAGVNEYQFIMDKLKIPVVVIGADATGIVASEDVIHLLLPFHAEELVKAIEKLTV